MNPQEKALNLISRFLLVYITKFQAKECATIAVNELIEQTGAKYWYDVKKEIEKL